ncbi:MAG: hypothetical protein J7L71_03250 [Spirochaetaceae bacterium]|nr:hypothetical protein [Spirochaetaceae bacterium]
MFKYVTAFLIMLITLFSCSFERSNPLDPDSTAANNFPSNLSISGISDFYDFNDTVVLTITASDIDGDKLTYEWSTNGGSFAVIDSQITIFTAIGIYGDYYIKCKVTDEKDAYSIISKNIHIGKSSSGILNSNERWTGTHGLSGDIVIPSDKTLTIDKANITVNSIDSNNLGSDINKIEIISLGTLIIKGDTANHTVISGTLHNRDEWNGIDSEGNYTINYLTVNDANIGLTVNTAGSMNELNFDNCTAGISINNSTIYIKNSQFSNCTRGISILNGYLTSFYNIFSCDNGIYISSDSNCDLGNISNADPTDDGNNSFLCSDKNILNFSTNFINAENNWWGTTISQDIDNKIYDDEESNNSCGKVDFTNYLNSQP